VDLEGGGVGVGGPSAGDSAAPRRDTARLLIEASSAFPSVVPEEWRA
jgi:hypothetical protein